MMLVQLWATTAANSPTPPLDVSQIKMYFSAFCQSMCGYFRLVMYFDAKCIIIFSFVIMCDFKNFHWSSDNTKVM